MHIRNSTYNEQHLPFFLWRELSSLTEQTVSAWNCQKGCWQTWVWPCLLRLNDGKSASKVAMLVDKARTNLLLPNVTNVGLQIFLITNNCNLHILHFCQKLNTLVSEPNSGHSDLWIYPICKACAWFLPCSLDPYLCYNFPPSFKVHDYCPSTYLYVEVEEKIQFPKSDLFDFPRLSCLSSQAKVYLVWFTNWCVCSAVCTWMEKIVN
jgi:hypothetical protein